MNTIPEKTIIQEIQPLCDNLHILLKERKEELRMTNQDVADITGLPLSNIAKLFSGALANPSVYNVAAVCICLGISIDSLFENAVNSADVSGLNMKIEELKAENARQKTELDFAERMDAEKERTIKRFDASSKGRRPIMYGIIAICALLGILIFGMSKWILI